MTTNSRSPTATEGEASRPIQTTIINTTAPLNSRPRRPPTTAIQNEQTFLALLSPSIHITSHRIASHHITASSLSLSSISFQTAGNSSLSALLPVSGFVRVAGYRRPPGGFRSYPSPKFSATSWTLTGQGQGTFIDSSIPFVMRSSGILGA